MKKLIIFATIVFAVVTLAVVSCQKDNQKEAKNSAASFNEIDHNENMDAYLLSFKNKLLYATKASGTMSLLQAEKDLNNLLNFDFGDANYATNIFQHDTLYFNLTIQQGQIALVDLGKTYQEMTTKITETYQSVTLPEKSVYYISCEFNEQNNTNDRVEVQTIIVTRGYSENTTRDMNLDDWRPQNSGGTCEGFLVGDCGAPETLKSRLENNISGWLCPNGRVYFTEQTTSNIDHHASNMYDSINNRPRLYVSYVYDQNNVCLTSDSLQYYYDQIRLLPTNFFGNAVDFYPPVPNNHVVLEYWINHRDSDCNNNTITLPWYWKLIVTHAKLNCTGSEINPK